jgi:RimJ/RimL family protein N-acetyltransferase
MSIITLRRFDSSDLIKIHQWPAYPPEFDELDYALRENGWLAEFHDKPEAQIYVAEQAKEIIAFSLLAKTGKAEAEFRIALRADHIGHGLGKTITAMTLHEGFSTMNLSRINLIVRKNNPRAISLYHQIGFKTYSTCEKTVNGKPTSFWEMAIYKPTL